MDSIRGGGGGVLQGGAVEQGRIGAIGWGGLGEDREGFFGSEVGRQEGIEVGFRGEEGSWVVAERVRGGGRDGGEHAGDGSHGREAERLWWRS